MIDRLGSARATLAGLAIAAVVVVWALRDLAVLVGYSVLLAYVMRPVVKAIERVRDRRGRHLPRSVVAACTVLGLVAAACWLVALAVPRLGVEASHLAASAPAATDHLVLGVHLYAAAHGFSAWLDPGIDGIRAAVPGLFRSLGGTLAGGVSRLFSGVGVLLGLALLPLLAFYLLAESDAVLVSALRLVPADAHAEIRRLGGAINRAMRGYVRGQAIVCLVTGVAVGVTLALLHHPGALLLGVLTGVAEVIPYLGFLIAVITIAIAGSSAGAFHAWSGPAAYVGINWAIGTFVTPRVMGRHLKMHPFVVTVSVLAGAQLMGPAGALLALPGAAVLQAVVGELAGPRPVPDPHGAPLPTRA